jgi:hypothetical protein
MVKKNGYPASSSCHCHSAWIVSFRVEENKIKKPKPDLMLDEQRRRLSHFNHVIIKSANHQTPFLSTQLPANGEGLLVKISTPQPTRQKLKRKTGDILGWSMMQLRHPGGVCV